MTKYAKVFVQVFFFAVIFNACDDHDENDGTPDYAGESCEDSEDCYPQIADHAELSGPVICLDDVTDGYCTHECKIDDDCCAAEGECISSLTQVCAPFQANNAKYCLITCEDQEDGDTFCSLEVHSDFICRSTGGGTENRKVCMP